MTIATEPREFKIPVAVPETTFQVERAEFESIARALSMQLAAALVAEYDRYHDAEGEA